MCRSVRFRLRGKGRGDHKKRKIEREKETVKIQSRFGGMGMVDLTVWVGYTEDPDTTPSCISLFLIFNFFSARRSYNPGQYCVWDGVVEYSWARKEEGIQVESATYFLSDENIFCKKQSDDNKRNKINQNRSKQLV